MLLETPKTPGRGPRAVAVDALDEKNLNTLRGLVGREAGEDEEPAGDSAATARSEDDSAPDAIPRTLRPRTSTLSPRISKRRAAGPLYDTSGRRIFHCPISALSPPGV